MRELEKRQKEGQLNVDIAASDLTEFGKSIMRVRKPPIKSRIAELGPQNRSFTSVKRSCTNSIPNQRSETCVFLCESVYQQLISNTTGPNQPFMCIFITACSRTSCGCGDS